MKFEKLKSGQYLCTLARKEYGLGADETPINSSDKFQRIADDVFEKAKEKFGEEAFNNDGRVCLCNQPLGENIYIGILTDKEKLPGKHINELEMEILRREGEDIPEEIYCHMDDDDDLLESFDDLDDLEELDDVEEFFDESPDLIKELMMIAVSFKKVTNLMSFLRANRHLLYVMTYVYKRTADGAYVFAHKGTNRELLSITQAKAAEFGAEIIKYPPSKEFMDEHYKSIDLDRLMSLQD